MEKTLKITALLATKMLGQNAAFDALIRSNFTEKELSLDITDRIKTFEDSLEYNGETLKQFEARTKNLDARKVVLEKLESITLALNEGKIMKYDGSTNLYYPFFEVSRSGFSFYGYRYTYSSSRVSSRLCFVESRLAVYAGKQFTELYEIWLNS